MFSVQNFTVTNNVLFQNTALDTVTVQFFMYVQCLKYPYPKHWFAVRSHRYRPPQYIFYVRSVCKILLKHNVLLSEHTVTDRHSSIWYVR